MMRRLALSAALVLLIVSCGKRGDPKPPVPVIPQATTDLAAAQSADRVILTWSYPSLTTAGRSLTSMRSISIFRYEEDLPVPTSGAEPVPAAELDPGVPRPVQLFSKVPTIPKTQFVNLATKIETIEGDELAAATAGAKLIFADAPRFRTDDGRPVRLTYAVVTEGDSARGDYSNLATIVPLPVAVAPSNLTATPRPEGVVLQWTAPDRSVGGGQSPVVTGYHVYRSAPGELPNELTLPATATPVTETTWVDAPPYGEYEYRVTAIAHAGPPLVQSALSAPARAPFSDLVPPPAPASVTPLVETNSIRLIWDPVAAPDLLGYKIYRMEGIGHTDPKDAGTIPVVIQPITETNYLHSPVSLGLAFRYAVTAVDKSGNESERTWSEWVVAPKNP